MKISLNWLKEYIPIEDSPEQVATILTDIGLEVEKYETVENIKGGLKGLVIGEIISKSKHPNADKLSLTQVNIGEAENLSIVCGAPNVAVGQKVVIAPVNCTIHPSTGEPFKIKKAKIRGELSQGMICAEDEIGLGAGHDGIMVLDDSLKVGTLAKDHFELKEDTIFEIGLTPNRGDAASHYGVARDLAVHYQRKISLPEPFGLEYQDQKSPIKLAFENNTDCLRYCGLIVKNVKVAPSPQWLRERIESIGLGSINNVVDVTNFVLHGLGQPIHAFDLSKIEGDKIIVGKAKKGEKFTTLDGKERELFGEELMIKDSKKNLAIAGVFGGEHSGITENTTTVFIESAYFSPSAIRKSAKLHGLNTDASFRYERGTDPEICEYAAKKVALLLQEVAGGTVDADMAELSLEFETETIIELDMSYVNKVIGEEIPQEQVFSILNGLEIGTQKINETKIKAVVPAYKPDIKREIDLVEEILRFYGYNNVKIPKKVNISFSEDSTYENEELKRNSGSILRGIGYHEMMTNSLSSSAHYKDSSLLVGISNPLSSELDIMRASMLPSALEAVAYNIKRKNSDIKLFEWGTVYEKRGDKFIQKPKLILIASGNTSYESWEEKSNKIDYFSLKSTVSQVLESMGLEGYKNLHSKQINIEEVSKKELKKFGINQPVFFAEIDGSLWTKKKKGNVKISELSKYPTVRRDLSLVVDKGVKFDEIRKLANKVDQKLIKAINVFDVFEGKPLEEGKKSYSVCFFMEHLERTLTDKEIDSVMNKLIDTFEKQLNATIRR